MITKIAENFGRLRGTKGSPYDGGHRVPCFIRYPAGGISGGVGVQPITANVDFMPTMLDLCGVTVLDERAVNGGVFDGRSIAPLLAAASSEVPTGPNESLLPIHGGWPIP